MIWLGFQVHFSSLGRKPNFSQSRWTCKLAILARLKIAPAPKSSSRKTTIAVHSLRQFLTKGFNNLVNKKGTVERPNGSTRNEKYLVDRSEKVQENNKTLVCSEKTSTL